MLGRFYHGFIPLKVLARCFIVAPLLKYSLIDGMVKIPKFRRDCKKHKIYPTIQRLIQEAFNERLKPANALHNLLKISSQ